MKTIDQHLDEMREHVMSRACMEFTDICASWLDGCKSHIEVALGARLVADGIDGISCLKSAPLPLSTLMVGGETGIDHIGGLYRQTPIGRYTADFYLEAFDIETGERWCRIIIECDGHDFHEKTKFQAAHDKKRDRWFQSEGIVVLRFTGSEIWASPEKCVQQIRYVFDTISHRFYARKMGVFYDGRRF